MQAEPQSLVIRGSFAPPERFKDFAHVLRKDRFAFVPDLEDEIAIISNGGYFDTQGMERAFATPERGH